MKERMNMRLSTSTNCVFYQRGSRIDNFVSVEQCLEECVAAGFQLFDINCCDNANPGMPLAQPEWEAWVRRVGRAAERLHVSFNQSHNPIYNFCHPETVAYYEWAEKMTHRCILCAGMLGVEWVVVHAGSAFRNGHYHESDTLEKNLTYLDRVLQLARSAGCRGIAIENMAASPDQSQMCETVDGLIRLVDAFHTENVCVCWDFGHAHLTQEIQSESLLKIGSRLGATHVADNNGLQDDHTLPMLGTVPWEEVMPILGKISYSGDLTYEIHKYMWNVPAALRASMLRVAVETGQYLLDMTGK